MPELRQIDVFILSLQAKLFRALRLYLVTLVISGIELLLSAKDAVPGKLSRPKVYQLRALQAQVIPDRSMPALEFFTILVRFFCRGNLETGELTGARHGSASSGYGSSPGNFRHKFDHQYRQEDDRAADISDRGDGLAEYQ